MFTLFTFPEGCPSPALRKAILAVEEAIFLYDTEPSRKAKRMRRRIHRIVQRCDRWMLTKVVKAQAGGIVYHRPYLDEALSMATLTLDRQVRYLRYWRQGEEGWSSEDLEEPEFNEFHDSSWVEPHPSYLDAYLSDDPDDDPAFDLDDYPDRDEISAEEEAWIERENRCETEREAEIEHLISSLSGPKSLGWQRTQLPTSSSQFQP